MNNLTTVRGAHLMTFNAEGRYGGDFTVRNRADWKRASREARERAGADGTVFLYAASITPLTGKLISVSASPSFLRQSANNVRDDRDDYQF